MSVSTNTRYTFTANANRSLTAVFEAKPVPEYTISATANPSTGGTVTGGGTYQEGASVTIRAVANNGYAFTGWREGSSIVSSNANYTFTASKNRTLTAVFNQVETPPEACTHDYKNTIIAPACTEQGYTTHTCSKCGNSYNDLYTAALGHSYGQWAVTTPATPTTNGSQERMCSRCGIRETSVIPATGTGTGNSLHGKVTVNTRYAIGGAVVEITLTPDPGYRAKGVTVTGDVSGKTIDVTGSGTSYSFKMPLEDVTIHAEFVKQ